MTDSPLETLLRETGLTYGHIQLFRDDAGWQASVCHYEPTAASGVTIHSKVSGDPVNALRAALLEDERRGREVERRYGAAAKMGGTTPPVDADGMCMICEAGGCDACNPVADDSEFEDLFG